MLFHQTGCYCFSRIPERGKETLIHPITVVGAQQWKIKTTIGENMLQICLLQRMNPLNISCTVDVITS